MATKKAAPKKVAKVTKPVAKPAKPKAPRKVAAKVATNESAYDITALADTAKSQATQFRRRLDSLLGNYIEPETQPTSGTTPDAGSTLADAVAINQAILDALTI